MREGWTIGLGAFFLCLALITLFVWIPRDIETGAVEIFRRTASIGDAMLPMALAIGMAVVSLTLIGGGIIDRKREAEAQQKPEETGLGVISPTSGQMTRDNGKFLVVLAITLTFCLTTTYFLGPLILAFAKTLGLEAGSYREMRATAPWKYIGYGAGGALLIFLLISFVEQSLRWRTLLIALAATVVIAILYDLPFEHLLLPPNGDY